MAEQAGFWLTVTDAGGGMVTGYVGRDTTSYPAAGGELFVSGGGAHDTDYPVRRGPSEVERLRALVQALEEEVAARTEDADALAAGLAQVDGVDDGFASQIHSALAAHDALTARFAPDGPNPPPDPVEGDSEALRGPTPPDCVECGHPMDAPHECRR